MFGLPFHDVDDVPEHAVAAVLGAGHSVGTAHDGAENGPFFLRTVSKEYTWAAARPRLIDLRHGGSPLAGIVDLGDVPPASNVPGSLDAIESVIRRLPPGTAPCLIGGDHSVSLAPVRALAGRYPQGLTVIQFDHHLDLQIWDQGPLETTPREPVFNTNVMSHISDQVGPGGLIQVGVSPYATVEAECAHALAGLLASVGTQVCLHSREIEDDDAFRAIAGAGRHVYLSIDVDVLDRSVMSSTGYPAEAGLSFARLLRLIDLVAEHNTVVGFDVVEFAAAAGNRDRTTLGDAQRATRIFLHVLGLLERQATACSAGGTEFATHWGGV